MSEYPTVTLHDPSSSMTATYVPEAGMICTSLAEDGVEYLGQRYTLDAYVSKAKTTGIPILYPWANRLSANTYDVDGAVVTLTAGASGVHTDEHGSPIHGVLAGYSGWVITAQSGNHITAVLDFGGTPQLLAAFPFPHVLTMTATLSDRTLRVETTVRPTTAAAVPLCFGFHPYVQLPGVPRQEWLLESPKMRHLTVDEAGLPTGGNDEWPGGTQMLADIELDDGYDQVPHGAVFAISAGGRRVAVTFEKGYPAAQIFAPGGEDLIGLEPMAAPTDALRRGAYRVAAPGTPETAAFSIRVS